MRSIMKSRRKPIFGTLKPPGWNRPRAAWHACEFSTLWGAALTVAQMEHLAGLCDREVLWKICDRIYHGRSPWQQLMAIMRSRARRRYERGELVREERIAFAIWCGDDRRQLPGFVRPQDKASAAEPCDRKRADTTKGTPYQPAPRAGGNFKSTYAFTT